MKVYKILLNILSVICFVFGACYIFSLVFIPVGIYCFTAGRLFSKKADHLLDNFVSDKKIMKGYTIFVSIACFPLGLLSIIAYMGIYGNNVKVQSENKVDFEVVDVESDEKEQVEENVEENAVKKSQESEDEKREKLEKLRKFKEKKIITEEEFEMAKQQMFGDDNKQ